VRAWAPLCLLLASVVRAEIQVDVKVAFVGDSGLGPNAVKVFQMLKAERVDLVLHQGDFDYQEDAASGPRLWKQLLDSELKDTPLLAALGNHDVVNAKKPETQGLADLYIADLKTRVGAAQCDDLDGLGTLSYCSFKGLKIVQSSVGSYKVDSKRTVKLISSKLSPDDASWKICGWHKVMAAMQIGGKQDIDGPGWAVYEACREAGAIIATAHEHSYARTHLMTQFGKNPQFDAGAPLKIAPGRTIAFVSGLGGVRPRPQLRHDAWWAAAYSRGDNNAAAGALICRFTDHMADCSFKDVNGSVVDRFTLTK
jgi:hypothetical protein